MQKYHVFLISFSYWFMSYGLDLYLRPILDSLLNH